MQLDGKHKIFVTQQQIADYLKKFDTLPEGGGTKFVRLSPIVMVLLSAIEHPDDRAVNFIDLRAVFTEIIQLNGSDIVGPVTVEVRLTLINGESKQELEQITLPFHIKQGESLMEGFMAFAYDFGWLYRSISKTLNPRNLYIAPPIHRQTETWYNAYYFYETDWLEQYYKIMELKKPEWLEEFYVKVREIEQCK